MSKFSSINKSLFKSLFVTAAFFAVSCGFLISCSGSKEIQNSMEAENLVVELSPTYIGRLSPINIGFACDVEKSALKDAVSIKPKIAGEWSVGADGASVVFTPSAPYNYKKEILVSVDMKKLLGKDCGVYQKKFCAMLPSYSVEFDELVMNEFNGGYSLGGTLHTDVPVSVSVAKKMLSAKMTDCKLSFDWDSEKTDSHHFTIQGISSGKRDRKLTVSWNGSALGLSGKQDEVYAGTKESVIPADGYFYVMDINTQHKDTILVSFSQPIDVSQNLNSYVNAKYFGSDSRTQLNVSARRNVLTIYSDSSFDGVSSILISEGLRGIEGMRLAQAEEITLDYTWEKPCVEFMTDGVILPSSQGTVLPVKTMNLSGLIVQAYTIYGRNAIQFLQVNDLDGSNEIYRVGEPVWQQSVDFEWNDSMQNKFIPRGIDLTELVKKYPDGMFQIRISFRKKHVKYECHANHPDFSNIPMPPDEIAADGNNQERSFWDYYNDMPWEVRRTFWTYRDDPCHPAYYTTNYNSKNLIKRNVIVSDIGIMAKKSAEGELKVTASDLKTALPLKGAKVVLHSFVGTELESAVTGENGTVGFKCPDNAKFVSVSSGKQISYLKLSEGTALSTSHFETGGVKNEGGVKGFIYGERGVWRPGDDIFLTFVLQDLNGKLPKDIPVLFELEDPLGRITESKTYNSSVNGFYAITTKTQSSATTGLWTARVRVGGREWTKSLRVETVVPNRLSVKLTASEEILVSRGNSFTLSGAWLHGAPTPGYSADVSVLFSPAAVAFDGYSSYVFENPSLTFSSARETLWSGYLSSDSVARFNADLDAGYSVPGKLKANFTSRIYEPGGAFSTEMTSMIYSPYERYVGLKLPKGDAARGMLLTDTDHTADVVLLTAEGKPVSSAELSYTVYKLDWKWWWEKDALTDATYISDRSHRKITEGTLDIKDGRGKFEFQVKYPDWGRYLVVVNDGSRGHSAAQIVYIDWPGWAGRAQESGSGSASMVPLVADKKSYTVGEEATISFASGKDQVAYVTIEKSGEVVSQQYIKTQEGTTKYTFKTDASMAPNIYVHITLLQKHMQTSNSLPIRLYGVVPVMVENPATKLTPQIECASVLEPGKEAVFSVSEKDGKPMTYTIAVVDEGLLGLTNFHGPELRKEFYKKEASLLLNWDIYKYVMNAYTGKLETLISVGGSEDFIDDRDRSANRFTPVVKYFGPFELAAGEKKATRFEMPQYVGAVRAVVIAGNKGAYGTAEKSVPVKSELMVQAALPRTLGTNETITVPVTVFNGLDKAQEVSVTMNVNGSGSEAKNMVQKIKLPASDNKDVYFSVDTGKSGTLNFSFEAKGTSVTARTNVPVEVISRGVPVTYHESFTVAPGKETEVSVQSPGEEGTATVQLELSTMPVINLSERLEYLIKYPHGCIEQITSGGFPQLYLAGFVKLNPDQLTDVKENVNSVISRYTQYQTPSGGMAYWAGNSDANSWGSCYAAHFLLEAKKKGYTVPDSLLNPLLNWIDNSASEWDRSYNDSSVQAYKVFVLALAGRANLSAMNRLNDGDYKEVDTRLLLASAYALSGKRDVASGVMKDVAVTTGYYRRTGGAFGSSIREQALFLFANTLLGNRNAASATAKALGNQLSSPEWMSTQETAWSLLSLLPFYSSQTSGKTAYSVYTNGQSIEGEIEDGSVLETLTAVNEKTQTAKVKNTGKASLYGTLTASGKSIPGTEKPMASGIKLSVTYEDENGRSMNSRYLKNGDTFVLRVYAANTTTAKIENIALTIPVPTCWEFSNDRIALDSRENGDYSYQDIRDDAIYTYFDLARNASVEFTFNVTVAYTGLYFVPAIQAEAMYDKSLCAVVPGMNINGVENASR